MRIRRPFPTAERERCQAYGPKTIRGFLRPRRPDGGAEPDDRSGGTIVSGDGGRLGPNRGRDSAAGGGPASGADGASGRLLHGLPATGERGARGAGPGGVADLRSGAAYEDLNDHTSLRHDAQPRASLLTMPSSSNQQWIRAKPPGRTRTCPFLGNRTAEPRSPEATPLERRPLPRRA